MGERTERTVLNHLIERCHDAERGFRTAAEQVNTPELKRLLLRLAEQRHEFAAELLPHAQRTAVSDGTRVATLHRAWMRVKARVAANPERAVLEEADRGESFALAAYEDAIHDLLPRDARELVKNQDLGIRAARRLVESELATTK